MERDPNTHLASEFYVLSSLNRLGLDAHLTLGNHKSVDILIKKDNGRIITIDVKGVRNGGWRMGTKEPTNLRNHYYVLVNYRNSIHKTETSPEVYIVASQNIKPFRSYSEKGGYGINYRKLQETGRKYFNNWKPFL
jgi:hypothetical protein